MHDVAMVWDMFAVSDANVQAILDLRGEVDEALDAFEAAKIGRAHV